MQNEKELLKRVRSALDKHEKRPFDAIKKAVERAQQAEQTTPPSGKVYRPAFRRFVPVVAACLVFVAIGAVLYASGGLNHMNAPTMEPASTDEYNGYVSETPPGTAMEGFSAAGDANSLEPSPVSSGAPLSEDGELSLSKDLLNQRIDPALLADMERHADDPDRLYAVTLISESDRSLSDKNEQDNSSEALFLTASEIYRLAEEGTTIVPATKD